MSDAISNLGGGGLSTPYLSNLATSLNYAGSCAITLFGGPLINKLGIKWSCIIAAVAMPLGGSGYYVQARYGGDAYLLASKLIGGITSGFLYVGETTAMLSYPYLEDRGLYLGIWSAMRNSGSVVGGAINFANNHSDTKAGGVKWSTYLIFIGFECTGFIWAILLSPTKRVRRRDGSGVPGAEALSWKKEFRALWMHLQHKRTWLVFMPAFYSFFYGATFGTYLSTHFSVRARALSTLITPSVTIVMVTLYGKFLLDNRRMSQKTRAWAAFLFWAIPQGACLIWVGIELSKFEGKVALDYGIQTSRWAEAWLPYLIMFSTGYWCQLSLYWILGTFSTDVKSSSRTGGLFRCFETLGQAIAYGINSHSSNKDIPFYVNAGFFVLVMPFMVLLVRLVPERPALVDDVADVSGANQVVQKMEQNEI